MDDTRRLPPEVVNAHVYGSFSIPFAGGAGVIASGPANFPGHPPAGPGTCEDGLWINAQGKRTAGSSTNPHPHCVSESSALEVVLEPISACASDFRPIRPCVGDTRAVVSLALGSDGAGPIEAYNWYSDSRAGIIGGTEVFGTIAGYAIDASTLGTTNRRVGILKFAFATLSTRDNLFERSCSLDEAGGMPCLNAIIEASYSPLPVGGESASTHPVPGFLWWTPAASPYNYGR